MKKMTENKKSMPTEKNQRLCEICLVVFREQLEKQKVNIPLEHNACIPEFSLFC